ncbi:pyocin knob domain-containing protein [Nitratireductor rhodophyticola]
MSNTANYNWPKPRTPGASQIVEIQRVATALDQADTKAKEISDALAALNAAYDAHTHAYGDLTGRPTTVAGFGITDAYTKTEIDTKVAADIDAAINALVNGSPGALDTLQELATAMGNDPNFATTVTNSLATKVTKALNLSDIPDKAVALGNLGGIPLAGGVMTGPLYFAEDALEVAPDNDLNKALPGWCLVEGGTLNKPNISFGVVQTLFRSADRCTQIAMENFNSPALYMRAHIGAGWTDWAKLTTDADKYLFNGRHGSHGVAYGSGGGGEIEVQGSGGGAAVMVFHRPGSRAIYFGLDTDGHLKRGGWSDGANAYVLFDEKNLNTHLIPKLVYQGANTNETNFPIGHVVFCVSNQGSEPNRNAANAVYLGQDDYANRIYSLNSSGSLLAGTWRSRGVSGWLSSSKTVVAMERIG